MHYPILLSLLAYGLLGLPFGAAAPLPSSSSLSLKERSLKPLHLEREFPSPTSIPTPSQIAHSPSFKRNLLFPSAVISAIATTPIKPAEVKKRQDNHPIETSLSTAKISEATHHLTKRQPEDSDVEERSVTTPGEEPRAWSGLDDNRGSDSDSPPSAAAITKTARAPADPDWNEEKKCWAPKHSPSFYGFIGAASAVAFWTFIQIVFFLLGLPASLGYFTVCLEYRRAQTKVNVEQFRQFTQSVVKIGTGDK
ncbi:hypothetical protein QBC45DRAFT_419469 [Copromyces sp. CBS 386.78]|nr:hypothetical protein QBC45DRAFT_419469 [Copromyces sp. CBS 386.78]